MGVSRALWLKEGSVTWEIIKVSFGVSSSNWHADGKGKEGNVAQSGCANELLGDSLRYGFEGLPPRSQLKIEYVSLECASLHALFGAFTLLVASGP